MSGSISLCPRDRNVLLDLYRRSAAPHVRLRAHIVLLLDEGYPWSLIAAVLFTVYVCFVSPQARGVAPRREAVTTRRAGSVRARRRPARVMGTDGVRLRVGGAAA